MLAIVIPYYKITFFEETLKSLANQTDKRFKVYIGDDASNENPSKLLSFYKNKFEFDYFKFNENLGSISLTKQWTRCVDLCGNEEWIMILGDDDRLDNSVVSSFYKNYNLFKEKTNLIRFASKLIDEDNKETSKTYTHPIWEIATDSFFRKYDATSRSSLSEHIFKKDIFLKYGFYNYPLAWSSDDRAWLEFSDGKPIYTINESIVYVRISTLNISGKKDNTELKNLSEISFFKYIISKKIAYYNNSQKLRLLKNYKKKIKVFRNLTIQEHIFIFYYFVKYLNFKWIKIAVKSLINKE